MRNLRQSLLTASTLFMSLKTRGMSSTLDTSHCDQQHDSDHSTLWLRIIMCGLTFSPDGNYIYFVRAEVEMPQLADVYQVPVLGGNLQQVAHDCNSKVTVSPDGKKIAFFRSLPASDVTDLVTVSTQDGEERVLAKTRSGEIIPQPAWSPDGKIITFNSSSTEPASPGYVDSSPLIAIDTTTGTQRRITDNLPFVDPAWLPDGRGLLAFLVPPRKLSGKQLVLISYKDGIPHQLTHDTSTYSGISISNDQKLLATVVVERRGTLEVSSSDRVDDSELQLASPVNEPWWNFSWTRDSSLLIQQYPKFLIVPPKATAATELSVSDVSMPSACGDGQHIVFWRESGIWRADENGGNLGQVIGKGGAPVCSRDGKWVYFLNIGKQHETRIMKVPLGGGEPQQLSNLHPEYFPFSLSSDDKLLAVVIYSPSTVKVAVISAASGEILRILPTDKRFWSGPRFTPDNRSIAYAVRDDRGYGIWLEPFDGSPGKFLVQPGPDEIGSFQWSFDGKKLALTRIHEERDVALIRNVN